MSARTQGALRPVFLAGVDGCRGGWLVVQIELRRGRVHRASVRLHRRFTQILHASPRLEAMALDMPIGLLNEGAPGGRLCDRLARRMLGRPRASSVFSPPTRRQLHERSSQKALPRGLTLQAWHIVPKIREVDLAMRPRDQSRVVEAHPELALARLAGRPMRWNKKTQAGRRERLRALARLPSGLRRAVLSLVTETRSAWPRARVAPDDLVDATVLCWTAWRVFHGEAVRVPDDPPIDRRGLRMEIWV